MLANLGEGVMLVRKADGVILETNPAQERLFGYAAGELIGRQAWELNAADDEAPEATAEGIIAPLNATGCWEGEIHNRRKDGSTFWTAAAVSTFDHPIHGTVWLSIQRDVTADRLAAARLRESESFARGVLDALPVHIAVLDGNGRIICVNDAWRQFVRENGGAADVIEGVGIDYLSACRSGGLLASAYADEVEAGIRSVIEGGRSSFAVEYPCHTATLTRWFLMSATQPGFGAAGVVVAHTDVSELKRLEEDRLRRGEALARASRLNSAAILASSLVHELTQPLTAASLYSEAATSLVVKGSADDPELADAVRAFRAQVKRASDIVHRLRNFIRGRTACLAAVSPRHIIVQAMKMVEPMALEKKVELVLEPMARGVEVEADAGQIEQVVVNLLCNAVEAVEAADMDRREVRVRTESRTDEVLVTVEDTGKGLTRELAERVFDVFETSKESGMGMGLAICRDIVEAHRGSLWADAQSPAGGAAFHFTLPLSTKGTRSSRLAGRSSLSST
ncbi:MAG: PAS domain-containing sensor histidine kinase [Chromatiaceae bacterium]